MKMKIFLFLIAVLLIPVGTTAQIVNGYGIKLGAARATQSWTYTSFSDPDLESRTGLDMAAFIELFDLKLANVLIEAHYIQKGFKERFPVTTPGDPAGTGEFLTFKPRVDYLSFPVLAKINLPMTFSPYIIAGPRFEIRVGEKPQAYEAVLGNLRRTEVGATIGFGFQPLMLSPVTLLAEVRYSPNFSKAFENSALNVKNKSFEFLAGIKF